MIIICNMSVLDDSIMVQRVVSNMYGVVKTIQQCQLSCGLNLKTKI